MLIRPPQVAGSFYPSDPAELRQFLKSHIKREHPQPAKAVILPHAGYVYSGNTACRVLSRVAVPDCVLLIGPNHRGIGSDFALAAAGEWETPLGRVPIHTGLAGKLKARSPLLREDPEAHALEHSLEVIVPMLQEIQPQIKIVPLIVGTIDLEAARRVALDCADVCTIWDEPLLIVISTDMNHYESDAVTRKKDRFALDAIEGLDAQALAEAVTTHRISMCGFVPVYMALVMAERLGIRKSERIDYTTSAEAFGDKSRVVGYAGYILS